MGAEISSNEQHAKTLDKYRELPVASIKKIVQRYKDKDCEFGLDKPALLDFMEDAVTPEEADSILQTFDRGAGMINALEFLTAITLVCEGERELKAGTVFDCFDFNNNGSITYDEMTILVLCFLRAIGIATGMNGEAVEDLIEKETGKKFTAQGMVSKTDYLTFVNELGFFNLNTMSKECLEKFGVVQPVPEEKATEQADASTGETPDAAAPVAAPVAEETPAPKAAVVTPVEEKNSENPEKPPAAEAAPTETGNADAPPPASQAPVEEKQENKTADAEKATGQPKVVAAE